MSKSAFIHFGGSEAPNTPLEDARIVVLPLCYEQGASYGTGSAEGPLHLLHASEQLERIEEETLIDWGKLKIHTLPPVFPPADPETAVRQMRMAAAAALERGKFLLALGGDHATSLGPIMAAAALYPGVGVLQIDAHLDLRDTWNGSRYNHACVMRRVAEDLQLPMVQVGIRSMAPEEHAFIEARRLAPVFAHQIDPLDLSWMAGVVDALPETVYLTVDLDGLDPSVIPGTGTPEPGGLTYRQLVGLIKAVGHQRKVVAADINELVKIPGTQVSEFTAAKIATKILVHCT